MNDTVVTLVHELWLYYYISNVILMDRSRDLNDTVVTLAHELGHSLGSKHDEDVGIPVLFYFFYSLLLEKKLM